jgi:hypothetical protein
MGSAFVMCIIPGMSQEVSTHHIRPSAASLNMTLAAVWRTSTRASVRRCGLVVLTHGYD